ncbi:putative 3'5'-cyclic nucleotide phosphodiesterase [Leishmania shawi]|uniref:Phosphodiesterase n=1 Tax=Leishmania shawi TaxID=5680 RepID=A0AAW3C3P0_9TRYP
MSDFLEQLQQQASMYAICSNTVSVMVGMSDTAEELSLRSYDSFTGTSYICNLSEKALQTAKASLCDNADWSSFFREVQLAFNSGKVIVQPGNARRAAGTTTESVSADFKDLACSMEVQCLSSSEEKRASFVLERTIVDQQKYILEHMLEAHHMCRHPKEYEQRLSHIVEVKEVARAKRKELDCELIALNDNLTRNKHKQKMCNERKAELLQKIGGCNTENTGNPWRAVQAKQQKEAGENNESRLPNPLGNRTCKDFDLVLFRMIKSRWLSPEECDASSPANRVVKPFSKEDFAIQVSQLSGSRAVVWKALDSIDRWSYRVFDVQVAMSGDDYLSLPAQTHGGSLLVTMYALLCMHDFLQKFNIDEQIALDWISAVEAGYQGNPYHNSMHAADVLQITHFVITQGGLAKRCNLSDIQVFSAMLAASIHDFDHPGTNNNFHVKTGSYLATLYNDRSVLENLHVSSVFELMKNPAFNILASFSDEERHEIRETMIEMVLATDMGSHGKYVASLKSKMQEGSSFTRTDEQILCLSIALKMADISNCGRPLDIYLRWGEKVSDEFYQQGDRERNLGLDCSPFMDRLHPSLAKSQIAFMNYIITPFFEQVADLLPDMRFAVGLVEENKAYWASHDDS